MLGPSLVFLWEVSRTSKDLPSDYRLSKGQKIYRLRSPKPIDTMMRSCLRNSFLGESSPSEFSVTVRWQYVKLFLSCQTFSITKASISQMAPRRFFRPTSPPKLLRRCKGLACLLIGH